MSSYVLFSHDGFGLGHTRRNTLLARAVIGADPAARVLLATGVGVSMNWLDDSRIDVLRLPSLVKARDGSYRNTDLGFEETLDRRSRLLTEAVRSAEPDVILVDRHPYGIAGELRRTLSEARRRGTRIVLGLRDVLDEVDTVRAEMQGDGWAGVAEMFDDVLVYGDPLICDHEAEYGLPVAPTYVGWVTEPAPQGDVDDRLLVVAAGGGGDGQNVYRLGVELLRRRRDWHGVVVAGPLAAPYRPAQTEDVLGDRLVVGAQSDGCIGLFARAGAVVQMAGYNSTFESLSAGVRPVLVPRRTPRREQAIRAQRLSALGLADVVDEVAGADEVSWLLDRSRRLAPGQVAAAGIRLDGAERAAQRMVALARERAA